MTVTINWTVEPTGTVFERFLQDLSRLVDLALGHAVCTSVKVTHVVSGHIHRGGAWQIAGAGGMIDCRVVAVSADLPGIVTLDLPD